MSMNFKNHLFIANPGMKDNVFAGTVILICEHTEKGALGVIVNRPTNILMKDVYQQLSLNQTSSAQNHDEFEQNPQHTRQAYSDNDKSQLALQHYSDNQFAHFGGPINNERGLVLHERNGNWQYSIHVNNYINLTTSQDIMKALANGKGPKRNVFILGYASWEPGQIEAEVLDNSWLTIPLDNPIDSGTYQLHNHFQTEISVIFDLLFATPAEKQWSKSIELLGINSATLSPQVGHA